MPIGVEAEFKGVVDLLTMKAYAYEADSGKCSESEIPGELKNAAEEARQKLSEDVSQTDDELLEKYLDGKELSVEELKKAIREGTRERKFFPILYCSSTRQIGVPQLLEAVIDYLPSPLDEGEVEGKSPTPGETEKRAQDPSAPFSAYVFKTIIDPFAGKLSVMRVISGKVAQDMSFFNANKQAKEKFGQMFRLEGKKQEIVKEASAGEIMAEKLKRKYGAEVVLKVPKVPYKETIRASASAQGKLKKQSGGRGQYGDTWLKIEPLPHGKGFEFVDEVVGGAIPRNYIPAVEKGVREAMAGGFLAGYPMVDIRVRLYDGSYHDVDSSDMAFKIAGSLGFKNAVEKAKLVILEPIMTMEVTVPDECMGDVIGDLNSRRGKVLGMETKGHNQVIKARVPMSEVLKYAPDLRSLTSGRGEFQLEFSHYEEIPPHLAERVIKEAKARQAADHGEKA